MEGYSEDAELRYLRTAAAIRERSQILYQAVAGSRSQWFTLDEGRLDDAAALVAEVMTRDYPDLGIPYHSRWRHFDVGGYSRIGALDRELSALDPMERGRARYDLAITSVLLDAGSGPAWRYRDPHNGANVARSEGLAVASYDLFVSGALSVRGSTRCRVDGARLREGVKELIALGFQVGPDNPLAGAEGRAALLQALGRQTARAPEFCGLDRPGGLYDYFVERAEGGCLRAASILEAVLAALAPIWPGRAVLAGENAGDAWYHPEVAAAGCRSGLVPFNKLSQWLTYSLIEPLEEGGIRVTGLDELTALAEYRNGGLLLDTGVLALRDEAARAKAHDPGSPLIVEWRALTICLIDRLAASLRRLLGKSSEELPLAKILQGGTWSAGREVAARLRPGGPPPLQVASDGTVF